MISLLLAGSASAAPPANDSLANAMAASPPATAAVSTVEATVENLEPLECNTTTIDKTAWFKYTPAESQTLVADTFGSNFDTVLVVYSGLSSPTFGTLIYVACNDDAFPALHSRVVFNASGGTTYYFQAGGLGTTGESGNLVFNLDTASPPPNDDLATANSVSLEAETAVDTAAATVETPEWLECDGAPVGKTVWFKYTAPADQFLIADTFGSDFDTILSVYSGPSSSPSFEALFGVGCNNHTLGFNHR
jgi:hypothetical protein